MAFVDDLGRQVLVEMHRAGAKLVGSGPLLSPLIEDIEDDEEAQAEEAQAEEKIGR